MSPSILIQAWQMAAQDLGIEIVCPFVLTLKNGVEVRADLLVKDFGPMLVGTDAAEETFAKLGDQLRVEGYGWSAFCAEELDYDRKHFIDILKDWGWTGPEELRPGWYNQASRTERDSRGSAMPITPETPAQSVVRAATLYHRGIICPSVAWDYILDAIGESDIAGIFDQLTPEEQRSIKAIYLDRPRSLETKAEDRPSSKPQVADLLRWCEQA